MKTAPPSRAITRYSQAERWGLFDWSRYQRRWDVPWGPGTTAAGFALWAGSFVLTGAVLVPSLALALHLPGLTSGTPEDKAVFTLFNQARSTAISPPINIVVHTGGHHSHGPGCGRTGDTGPAMSRRHVCIRPIVRAQGKQTSIAFV